MILLSFTSAIKYALGLMLVMLGFIPYDALEQHQSSNGVNQVTVESVEVNDQDLQLCDTPEFQYEIREVELPEIPEVNPENLSDSVNYFIVRYTADSLMAEYRYVVIVTP